MTHATKPIPRLAAVPAAAIAALLLAGCSTGHIGETWQCPLAEGGACDSVAAADPAVPAATGGTVLGEPLWRVRGAEPSIPAETPARRFAEGLRSLRLAGAAVRSGGRRRPKRGRPEGPRGALRAGGAAAGRRNRAKKPLRPPPRGSGTGSRRPSGRPGPGRTRRRPGPAQDDLRTGEVVARIWIAPFVDGNGVYREASHVRVVLEPAGWRLP